MRPKEEEKVRDDGDVIASTRGRVGSPERCRRVIFIYQMNSEPNIASSGRQRPRLQARRDAAVLLVGAA